MEWIVTLAEWEMKVPPSRQPSKESIWTSAELPLDTQFFFIVNTVEEKSTRAPARSIAVVTTARLLDLLGRIEPATVCSAYLLRRGDDDQRNELQMHRLRSIRTATAEDRGWTRVVVFEAENVFFTDPGRDADESALVNEFEVFSFDVSH